MKTQRQRLNLKWSIEDIDRLYRFARSGMSIDQVCGAFIGSGFRVEPDEIERLIEEISATGYVAPRVEHHPRAIHGASA